VGAEQAAQRGLVLEDVADGAVVGQLGRLDFGRGGADRDRLLGAARGRFGVVGVAGVAGDPVVGGGLGRARAGRRRVVAVLGDRHRAVGGDRAAFALGVVIELPGDLAPGVGAEQAAQRGLVLEDVADGAVVGQLGRLDFGRGGADRDRLLGAARGRFGVVGVAGVAGDPVVEISKRRITSQSGANLRGWSNIKTRKNILLLSSVKLFLRPTSKILHHSAKSCDVLKFRLSEYFW